MGGLDGGVEDGMGGGMLIVDCVVGMRKGIGFAVALFALRVVVDGWKVGEAGRVKVGKG